MGATNWRSAGFSEVAKKMLRKLGPKHFRRTYGDYYVVSEIKGATIDVKITSRTSSTDTSSSISASLEASFQGFGASGGGSASFK